MATAGTEVSRADLMRIEADVLLASRVFSDDDDETGTGADSEAPPAG
ncbi:MAG: hypothetical protein ACRD1K_20845 [Acidimicrobiales bacterium]